MGQAQSVGIRAGLNYSTFLGPLEEGESYSYSDGFHFGFNYGYKFTNRFMVRAELLYTQIGGKKTYHGQGYYKIYPAGNKATVFERGMVDMELTVSNAYINVPIVAAFKLNKKFEIFGGASVNFLINPIARGKMRFESFDRPEDILFIQSLDYRYYQDKPLEGRFSSTNIAILIDGEREDLPRFAGAYYQYNEVQKVASYYNWFDVSLTGGLNYFFNKGFYMGISIDYGLLDVTDDRMDVSLRDLRADNKFNYRLDKDINLAGQLSLGFRF